MAKRGRKRKLSENENSPSEPSKPKIDRSTIQLQGKHWMPESAVNFFEKYPDIEEKLQAIDHAAKLIGPFRKLRGETDVDGIELLMLDREATDLPELQVFIGCSAGRYAFWRDTSDMINPMVVFMDRKAVPDINVIGNIVEHAIIHFCEKFSKLGGNSLKNSSKKPNILGMEKTEVTDMCNKMNDIVKARKRICVGGEVSGPGLIHVDCPRGNNGYRNLSCSTELLLRSLKLVGIKTQEAKVEQVIDRLLGEVMVCNDERDFANGLELGHLLFLSNKKSEKITEPMSLMLCTAYKNLGRLDFLEIFKLTLELRGY
uniref:Uncharacterized protein n=1 Tax=Caenorhabditis japonica TaxID=281687 RepID=A0A8R1DUI2_CAEJA